MTDDSIAIIRPIPIIAIGEPAAPAPTAATPPPAPPGPPPSAAPSTTPAAPPGPPPAPRAVESAEAHVAPVTAGGVDLRSLPADLETTLPSGTLGDAADTGPSIVTETADLHAEDVEALEEIEPDRESSPVSSEAPPTKKMEDDSIEEIEPAEVDADRISAEELDRAQTDEIPVVMEVEPDQPKRPPPPSKRTPPPSAPPASAGAPPSKPPPASKPAPPSSKAESKKRPWWDEIFSEDLLRTMDTPKLSFVQREVDFIEDSLGVEKGAVVLDLACGTGSHAVELASRGYSVVGFDLSLAMLARASDEAQERGQKLNFLQGDMREMAFEEMFDGIYCWHTSFGYFDEEKNLEVLSRARRALRQGGMLLLDIINRDFAAPRQPSLVWFEGDGCVCMDEMHVDFFTSRLKVKRTVMFEDGRTREVDYSIRLYNLHEVGKMMHDCGFRVVQVTGHPAHPGVFFGSESPRIIVLAERAD
ncbi:MAG: methyltransferase domain-containing protein [Polyangiaceae bacterium]